MVETKKGSPDGINVFEYAKGKSYDLPQGLADIFIREGWAEWVKETNEERIVREMKEKVIEEKVVEIPETQVIRRETKVIKHRERKNKR
jgi:hypothetical protein